VSAGHPHPLCQSLAEGTISELVGETCCPLGVEDDLGVPVVHHQLAPGDRLIIYTDGLVEQENPDGSFFDLAGVYTSLGHSAGLPPQAAVDRLIAAHHDFAQLERPTDDVTILVMDVMGRPTAAK
jgi:serine phosphatase RsbU (regulator of sigma subunit)